MEKEYICKEEHSFSCLFGVAYPSYTWLENMGKTSACHTERRKAMREGAVVALLADGDENVDPENCGLRYYSCFMHLRALWRQILLSGSY
jgi:hypothetical protein